MAARSSWDEYFLTIAQAVATRSTCERKHVGAVIVREKYILATGYNGSGAGEPHCDERGHLMVDGHCLRTMHAERNAIWQVQMRKLEHELEGATIYTTASPCWECIHRVAEVKLTRVVFAEFYRDSRIYDFCRKHGIELVGLGEGAQPPPAE